MSEKPKKILVADDEADLREAVKIALLDAGYEVLEARDGEETLSVFKKTKPDLVLLDLNMPKVHGLQVLKKIREEKEGENTPVVILTAQDSIATVSDAVVIGGTHTDFLPKADSSLRHIIEHVNQHFNK